MTIKDVLESWNESVKPKDDLEKKASNIIRKSLEKQIPKKVIHFLEDDTFETTCCGADITNEDYEFCPYCGQLLGEVEEVLEIDE